MNVDRHQLAARHAEAVAWARILLDRVNSLPRTPTWTYAVANLCDRSDEPKPPRLCACGCGERLPHGMAATARHRPACRRILNQRRATASQARKKQEATT